MSYASTVRSLSTTTRPRGFLLLSVLCLVIACDGDDSKDKDSEGSLFNRGGLFGGGDSDESTGGGAGSTAASDGDSTGGGLAGGGLSNLFENMSLDSSAAPDGTLGTLVGAQGSCSAFEICGGDASGQWAFDEVCMPMDVITAEDIGEDCDVSGAMGMYANGLMDVDSASTATVEATLSLQLSLGFGADCFLPNVPLQSDCDEVAALGATEFGSGFAGDCLAVAGGCECEFTTGSEFSGEEPDLSAALAEGNYCVDGDILRLVDASAIVYELSRP